MCITALLPLSALRSLAQTVFGGHPPVSVCAGIKMATAFDESNLQALLDKVASEEGFVQPRFSIENATKPGENFVGRIFRVLVTEGDDSKSLSLIFKASSPNRARQEMMGSDRLFRTESDAYTIILPGLNAFLKKHGVCDAPIFPGTARCFATESTGLADDAADVIVLEDKKPEGFVIVDIKTGLDCVQCRLVLEKVALLHAAAMAMDVLDPQQSNSFKKLIDMKLWTADIEKALTDLKKGFQKGLSFLEEPYKEGNAVYANLLKIYNNFHVDFLKCYEPPEDFSCITHGDCWSNNILFKVNRGTGVSEDVCLLDFQTPRVSSPVNDLASCLLLCSKKEVRDHHIEGLLRFYHDQVTKTLRAFKLNPDDIFPWSLFQSHLRLHMRLGVIQSLFGLPVLMADKSEIKVDIHSEEGDKTLFSETAKVTNPETLKVLKRKLNNIVALADKMGFI